MLRGGLRTIGVTFLLVALVLLGQVVDRTLRHVPGLYPLFAACDLPTTTGAWLVAVGAWRLRGTSSANGDERVVRQGPPGLSALGTFALLASAVAFTVVASVVYGDFLAPRVGATELARILGGPVAWRVADVGTIVGLGSLAVGLATLAREQGRPLPPPMMVALGALWFCRGLGGVIASFAPVPWPFTIAEAALFASIGAISIGLSSVATRIISRERGIEEPTGT